MSSSSRCLLAFGCVALLVAVAGATQYKVGGDNGWGVPGASAESYNTWAEKTSFRIGDQLLFVYPKDNDSVLLVEPADYNACNTSSYDKRFDDGSTAFDLDRSGAFFFISGVEASCRANEKLIIMVAAANSTGNAPPPSQSQQAPPQSPSNGATAQAPPPSSPNAPATAAAGKNSTAKGAPPAAGNDKNGAGLTVAGLTGSFVACMGYAMLAVSV